MSKRNGWSPPRINPLFEPAVTINAPSTTRESDVERARQTVASEYRVPVQMVESTRVEHRNGERSA